MVDQVVTVELASRAGTVLREQWAGEERQVGQALPAGRARGSPGLQALQAVMVLRVLAVWRERLGPRVLTGGLELREPEDPRESPVLPTNVL